MTELNTDYYVNAINLKDLDALEARLKALTDAKISSVSDLETWTKHESALSKEIQEVANGHEVDFYRDTANGEKRETYIHDRTAVQALLQKYQAALDRKFSESPFADNLNEKRYGLMRRVRQTRVKMFREENIPLSVREDGLSSKYTEIMGGLTVEWEGEQKPMPLVQALMDSPDRSVRELAWHAMAEARMRVKPEMDAVMNELIQVRHQMAVNAGYENYRDYMFDAKNREYTIQDCYDYHQSVEKYVIPVWGRLADVFKKQLGVENYRPWDTSPCTLQGAPFSTVTELMDGVEEMLSKTDTFFGDRFKFMRNNGLLDLEGRQGKQPGGFMELLPVSKNAFVFANISPSFFAIIALIHEMGHAVNFYKQFENEVGYEDYNARSEVAELYSHGMELLLLDKLNRFYPEEQLCKKAQREELRRALNMLMGPLSGDLFQHWLYTHPNHTIEERDAKYLEINKRFMLNPVDISGVESLLTTGWYAEPHVVQLPFYNIEYSMSELGALQLLETYRENPEKALALYKQGASSDLNQSIAEIYRDTGVNFDCTAPVVRKTAEFVEQLIGELM